MIIKKIKLKSGGPQGVLAKLSRATRLWFALALASASAWAGHHDLESEYLLFPLVHSEHRPNVSSHSHLEEFELHYGLDLVYSLKYEKLRFLGEFFVSDEEREIERLKLGLELGSQHILWLGRFHSPLDYWNTEFHHGAHYQNSIHRPSIAEYEDDGGVLPNHITGAVLEGRFSLASSAWDYNLAAGLGPILGSDGLQPYGHDDGHEHDHAAASHEQPANEETITLRLVYRGDEMTASHKGFFINRTSIPSMVADIVHIEQQTLGSYIHQAWLATRLTASLFYVENDIKGTLDQRSRFASGYVHLEHELSDRWLVYGRKEHTWGQNGDPYLALFNHYLAKTTMAGLRFDISRRQAVSFEAAAMERGGHRHNHFSFQWSAVYP